MPIKSLVKQIFGSSHFRPVVIPFSAKVFLVLARDIKWKHWLEMSYDCFMIVLLKTDQNSKKKKKLIKVKPFQIICARVY